MEENNCRLDSTLKTRDELHLSNIDIDHLPKNILFPDELNRYLRDQIEFLKYENAMLRKNFNDQESALKDRDRKIKDLEEKKVDSQKSKTEFITSSQVASTKIVELTKKLREKNSEVETLKTKCCKLEAALTVNEPLQKNEISNAAVDQKPKNEMEDQLKKLQDKLNATTTKYLESKNSITQLRNEIKAMKKVLQQEVGDNLENVLNSSVTTWRGRAQVICDLQQKNLELREKLKNIPERSFYPPSNTDAISKAESKISVLSKENNEIKISNDEMSKKIGLLKTRQKIMETDHALLKSKLNLLNEKSDQDREMIDTLRSQVLNSKELRFDELKQKDKLIKRLKMENDNLQADILKYQYQLENSSALLEEKKKEIDKLKNESGDFLSQCQINDLKKDNEGKMMSKLEAERLRLLELMQLGNKKLQSTRDQLSETHQQLRFEKQRAAKLESSLARLELDQNQISKSGSYSNLSSKTQDSARLKDELELALENIKALKTRIDIEKQERNADFIEFSKIIQSNGESGF